MKSAHLLTVNRLHLLSDAKRQMLTIAVGPLVISVPYTDDITTASSV